MSTKQQCISNIQSSSTEKQCINKVLCSGAAGSDADVEVPAAQAGGSSCSRAKGHCRRRVGSGCRVSGSCRRRECRRSAAAAAAADRRAGTADVEERAAQAAGSSCRCAEAHSRCGRRGHRAGASGATVVAQRVAGCCGTKVAEVLAVDAAVSSRAYLVNPSRRLAKSMGRKGYLLASSSLLCHYLRPLRIHPVTRKSI